MNVKQFKRRWLNSKVEPELFYLPVKKEKEEEPVYSLRIWCKTFAWRVDNKIVTIQRNDIACYAMFVIIDKNRGTIYRSYTYKYIHNVSLPEGEYKLRWIIVHPLPLRNSYVSNGAYVNNRWYDFRVTNRGQFEILENEPNVITASGSLLTIWQPSSVWKTHVYINDDIKIPCVKPKYLPRGVTRPRNWVYTPDGTSDSATFRRLYDYNVEIEEDYWGAFVADIYLDNELLVKGLLIGDNIDHTWQTNPLTYNRRIKHEEYDYVNINQEVNTWIGDTYCRVHPIHGYINSKITSTVAPGYFDNKLELDFKYTASFKAHLGNLFYANKITEVPNAYYKWIPLYAYHLNSLYIHGQPTHEHDNSEQNLDVSLIVDENTFNCAFSNDAFYDGNRVGYYPTQIMAENLLENGEYSVGLTARPYSPGTITYEAILFDHVNTHIVLVEMYWAPHEYVTDYTVSGMTAHDVLISKSEMSSYINTYFYDANEETMEDVKKKIEANVNHALYSNDYDILIDENSDVLQQWIYESEIYKNNEYAKHIYDAKDNIEKLVSKGWYRPYSRIQRPTLYGTTIYYEENYGYTAYIAGWTTISCTDDWETYFDDPNVIIIE